MVFFFVAIWFFSLYFPPGIRPLNPTSRSGKAVISCKFGASTAEIEALEEHREHMKNLEIGRESLYVKQNTGNQKAKRKDGSECFFLGYSFLSNTRSSILRMRSAALKHPNDCPRYWSKFTASGKRQKRTVSDSAGDIESCRAFLLAEAATFHWISLRAQRHCDMLEARGKILKAGKDSESPEHLKLEEQWVGLKRVTDHHSEKTNSDNWGEIKKVMAAVYDDLYFLKPRQDSANALEEEMRELELEGELDEYLAGLKNDSLEDVEEEDVVEVED